MQNVLAEAEENTQHSKYQRPNFVWLGFLQLLLFISSLSHTWINKIDPEYTSTNAAFRMLSETNSRTCICKNYLDLEPSFQISIISPLQKAGKAWRSRRLLPISGSPERAGKSWCWAPDLLSVLNNKIISPFPSKQKKKKKPPQNSQLKKTKNKTPFNYLTAQSTQALEGPRKGSQHLPELQASAEPCPIANVLDLSAGKQELLLYTKYGLLWYSSSTYQTNYVAVYYVVSVWWRSWGFLDVLHSCFSR